MSSTFFQSLKGQSSRIPRERFCLVPGEGSPLARSSPYRYVGARSRRLEGSQDLDLDRGSGRGLV